MSRISTSKYLFPGMVVPTVRAFPSHALVVVFGLSCCASSWRAVVGRRRGGRAGKLAHAWTTVKFSADDA
jgi:hypothetical protein